MISVLTGLFLLGILLALIRLKDRASLWGCIGLHGGLVGLWFLTNNGLLEISEDAPKWLVGPGNLNTNPLGGVFGISLIFLNTFNNPLPMISRSYIPCCDRFNHNSTLFRKHFNSLTFIKSWINPLSNTLSSICKNFNNRLVNEYLKI